MSRFAPFDRARGREVALVAAGALASWLLYRVWPPQAAGPLAGTLAIAPLVAGLFAAVAHAGRRLGGRRIPPSWIACELVALVVLGAGALASRGLDLAAAAPALAAGFAALALLHTAAQLVALRPLLGRRLPERPSVLFFLLPFALYLALLPWAAERRAPDGDEPYYLLLTHSLVYDGDVELANDYAGGHWRYFMDRPIAPQPGDPVGAGGEIYSRHDALLPALLAVPYRLGGRGGVLAAMCALAALLAWLTLRLAARYDPDEPGGALLAYALLALAPPLLVYAHQVWVEVPAAVAAAFALERALALGDRRREEERGASWPIWLALALGLAALPWLKIRFALVALPIAWIAVRRGRTGRLGRRGAAGAAGAMVLVVAALGALLAFNQVRYGNPLKIHAWSELLAVSPGRYLAGLTGLFWDAAFGLFSAAPIWLLLAPAVALAVARRTPAVGHLALVAMPYLLFAAPRAEWYGGWSPPFRYGVVFLPLLAVVLAPLLAARRRPGAHAVFATLAALTAALALIWVAAPGLTFDFAHGRTRLLDALSTGVGADVARLFPSYVRPRLASWLWPPLSALLVTLLWWWPRRSPRAGAPAFAGAGRAAGPALGVTLLLLGVAAVPALAALAPTRIVELEDPWLLRRGGHVHPERWVVARGRFRGGWVLRPGEAIEIPVHPGGEILSIALDAQLGRNNPDPLTLELRAGDRRLARWSPADTGRWQHPELGPFDWPRGEPLVLAAVGPQRSGRQNGLLLDRVELRWR